MAPPLLRSSLAASGESVPILTAPGTGPRQDLRWVRAGARWTGAARGVAARVQVTRPRVVGAEHSLVEVLAQLGTSGRHAAEIGLRISPTEYGDGEPHLFVFAWAHGRRTCYDGCGWADAALTTRPGDSLADRVGTEVTLGLVLVDGVWWAWLDTDWLGAFSPEVWSGAFSEADGLQWFGEVFTPEPPARSQMGTGAAADSRGAATLRGLCHVPWDRWICQEEAQALPFADEPVHYGAVRWSDGRVTYGGPGTGPAVTPRPPPSSASEGTPSARGTSAPSRPR